MPRAEEGPATVGLAGPLIDEPARKRLVRTARWVVVAVSCLVGILLLVFSLAKEDLTQLTTPQNTTGPNASNAKEYNPTYELACGEALGPSLRDLTKIDKAILVEPPDCVSGIIMVPKNAFNVDVKTPDGAPIAGNWYYQKSGVAPGTNLLSNLRKVPFADEENGINDHTWGIPIGFDLRNPQVEKVTVIARFSHNPT